jgi:hypothetical protein
MSPTARSLKLLRQQGYCCDVVERWLAAVRRRRDYLGCIDIIACRRGEPVLAVQATSASNVAARLKKDVATPGLHVWLATGHAVFEVWGWRKNHTGRWEVRRVAVRGEDLAAAEVTPKRPAARPVQRLLFPE